MCYFLGLFSFLKTEIYWLTRSPCYVFVCVCFISLITTLQAFDCWCEAYAWFSYPCVTFWAYFLSLKLKYIGLQGHHAICVCVCVCFISLITTLQAFDY